MFAKIYLFPLMVLIITMAGVDNRLVVKLTGLKCKETDRNFSIFTKCSMKAVGRDTAEVTVRSSLIQIPVDNIVVSFYLKRRGFEHLRPLVEYKFDVCNFLRNKRHNLIAESFYTLLGFQKYSNMNHTCPFSHDLAMEKFRFNETHIQLVPFPSGHYRLGMEFYIKNIHRANITVFFHLIERNR